MERIDKELLPMKSHYFFYNAATAPVVPFLPTLARQLGFSTVIVGAIYTVLPVIGMLAKPIFGFIADRYHRHRLLFLSSEILTAIAFFLILFIPQQLIQQELIPIEFHCHDGSSDLRYASASDKCIAQNLQQQLGNKTISCQVHCETQPYMWDIVCQEWLHMNKELCLKQYSSTYLSLILDISIDKMYVQKDSLFFTIPHNQAYLHNQSVNMYCPKQMPYFNASCHMACIDNYLNSALQRIQSIPDNEALGLYQFWLFFILLIVSWIGMAVTVSIGDAICFTILGERHHLYGKQRLYGSIGYGLFAIISGLLVDSTSSSAINKDYTIIFWMTAIIYCFDVFASSKLKVTTTQVSTNIMRDMGKMFLSIRCIVFFVWCICIGLCTALIWNFLLWYLEELEPAQASCQNSMKTLEGIVLAIQSFGGELPFFFVSGWLLKKIGHANAMSLVLFAFVIRFSLYALLTDPWWVLPIELLNGITSGIFYATIASYANIVAPLGTQATMQGFVGAIFEGVGVSLGSLIGGILFASVGGSKTFLYFAIGAQIAFILHICAQCCMKRYAIFDANKLTAITANNSMDNISQSSLASLQP